MKKVLLLSLGLVMGHCAFAQSMAVKKQMPTPGQPTMMQRSSLGAEVVEGTPTTNPVFTAPKSVVAYETPNYYDFEAMYTTYDLQSNGFVANRMYQLKDGSVAVTATFSADEYDAEFLDRGTGYNFAHRGKVGKWGGLPYQRIEATTEKDMRTGWPSIAPYGAEGEILVSHSAEDNNDHKGLYYWVREKAGVGAWDGPHAIANPEGLDAIVYGEDNYLSWARIATTGENNDVLHIFAAASGDSSIAHYYLRTADLENWEVEFSPLSIDELHVGRTFAADDYAVSANGNNIAIVYCAGYSADVLVYESKDQGETWNSRLVWECPFTEEEWSQGEFDQNNIQYVNEETKLMYAPTHASIAVDANGVSHVALGTRLYDVLVAYYYRAYVGMACDGVAYWNSELSWEEDENGNPVPSPIRSVRDDSLKHALRLWWDDPEKEGYIQMDITNFCAWMPPHAEEGYNNFDYNLLFTGEGSGAATDYPFGITGYPAIAVDPAGNLAIAYSSPDVNRALWQSANYYRSIFVNYKPADSATWGQMPIWGLNLYSDFVHSADEATFISAVSTPVNENEFWFSCFSDDTPGFYTGSYASQANITNSIVNVFKFDPNGLLNDEEEEIGLNEAIDVVYNIFPNPATDFIKVSSSSDANATVTFSNIAGQTVKVVNTNLTTGDNVIAVSDLTSGVYFCTVSANGYSHTTKVVVK